MTLRERHSALTILIFDYLMQSYFQSNKNSTFTTFDKVGRIFAIFNTNHVGFCSRKHLIDLLQVWQKSFIDGKYIVGNRCREWPISVFASTFCKCLLKHLVANGSVLLFFVLPLFVCMYNLQSFNRGLFSYQNSSLHYREGVEEEEEAEEESVTNGTFGLIVTMLALIVIILGEYH